MRIGEGSQEINVETLIRLAIDAGEKILEVYERDFAVETKDDKSPLTEADKLSNDVIVNGLTEMYPNIPIISEENKLLDFSERKDWNICWLVDPLDGTKEFIKKNGEFTVNIALIKNGEVVLGVVYVPVTGDCYFGSEQSSSFRLDKHQIKTPLSAIPAPESGTIKIAGSRSHPSPEMEAYLTQLKERYQEVEFVSAGSSLKICMVAEGKVHLYPRLGPTMEWDTAAGHAVIKYAGGELYTWKSESPLRYNKENLLNPFFIVQAKKADVSN